MSDNHVTVKLPQLAEIGRAIDKEDKIFVWDAQKGELTQARVGDLPFGSGGGGGGNVTQLGSPFKVRFNTPGVSIIENPGGVFNTVVADIRLLGKTDYPVNTTQLNNAAFRDDELTYDQANGKVTIKNFVLKAGEIITLYPDGIADTSNPGGGDFAKLIERIELLEMIAAPFIPTQSGANGGVVPFMRPFIEIPLGWAEVVELRGRTVVGLDVTNAKFDTIGKTGGDHKYTLIKDNLPVNKVKLVIGTATGGEWRQGGGSGRPIVRVGDVATDNSNYNETTIDVGGTGKEIDLMNPYRIVHWIKFVGI